MQMDKYKKSMAERGKASARIAATKKKPSEARAPGFSNQSSHTSSVKSNNVQATTIPRLHAENPKKERSSVQVNDMRSDNHALDAQPGDKGVQVEAEEQKEPQPLVTIQTPAKKNNGAEAVAVGTDQGQDAGGPDEAIAALVALENNVQVPKRKSTKDEDSKRDHQQSDAPYRVYSTPFLAGGETQLPNVLGALVTGTKNFFKSIVGGNSEASSNQNSAPNSQNNSVSYDTAQFLPPVIRMHSLSEPEPAEGSLHAQVNQILLQNPNPNPSGKRATFKSTHSVDSTNDDLISGERTPKRYSQASAQSTFSTLAHPHLAPDSNVYPAPITKAAAAAAPLDHTSTPAAATAAASQRKRDQKVQTQPILKSKGVPTRDRGRTMGSLPQGGNLKKTEFERQREEFVVRSIDSSMDKIILPTTEPIRHLRKHTVLNPLFSEDSIAIGTHLVANEKDRGRSHRRVSRGSESVSRMKMNSSARKRSVYDLHPVETDVDIGMLREESRRETRVGEGVSGLKETVLSRTNIGMKKHIDKDFIDHFAEKQGTKYIQALEDMESEYKNKLAAELRRVVNKSELKDSLEIFPIITALSNIIAVDEEKDLNDFDFGLIMDYDTSKFEIDVSKKVTVLRKMHRYAHKMLLHWMRSLGQRRAVRPESVVSVGTELLADMMIPQYGIFIRIAGYVIAHMLELDKERTGTQNGNRTSLGNSFYDDSASVSTSYGPDINGGKGGHIRTPHGQPPNPHTLLTNLRNLMDTISDEIGAIGESFAKLLVRIPDLPRPTVINTINQLFLQVNYANTALSRAMESLQPLLKLYTVMYYLQRSYRSRPHSHDTEFPMD